MVGNGAYSIPSDDFDVGFCYPAWFASATALTVDACH